MYSIKIIKIVGSKYIGKLATCSFGRHFMIDTNCFKQLFRQKQP